MGIEMPSPRQPCIPGCSMDQSDREQSNFHVARSNTQSLKYLGVKLTSDLTDTADVDAKLARGRGTFKSLSEVFRSTAPPIRLRVKLFQTLIVPTVLHGCECWTLSRTVCDKLNVFSVSMPWDNTGSQIARPRFKRYSPLTT